MKNVRIFLILGILLAGVLASGCTSTGSEELNTVKAQLASSQGEVDALNVKLVSMESEIGTTTELKMTEITVLTGEMVGLAGFSHVIEGFEAKYGIKVNWPEGGHCGTASKGLADGSLDVAFFCCPLNKDETGPKGMVDVGSFGRDAVVFVVNKDNPITGLTTQQLRDIYQGKITNWKEVGGNDAVIEPHADIMCGNRMEEYMRMFLVGTRDFKAGKIGVDNTLFADSVTKTKKVDIPPTVAANPNVIAPIGRAYLDDSVKLISVDGIMPTDATISDETYPIVRYFHVGTKGIPDDAVKLFIDYVRSEEGQQFLEKGGVFVSLPS